MMKAINNWLDKPLTWREVIKDTIIANAICGGALVALAGSAIAIDRYKKKAVTTFSKDFEVERTDIVENEE